MRQICIISLCILMTSCVSREFINVVNASDHDIVVRGLNKDGSFDTDTLARCQKKIIGGKARGRYGFIKASDMGYGLDYNQVTICLPDKEINIDNIDTLLNLTTKY